MMGTRLTCMWSMHSLEPTFFAYSKTRYAFSSCKRKKAGTAGYEASLCMRLGFMQSGHETSYECGLNQHLPASTLSSFHGNCDHCKAPHPECQQTAAYCSALSADDHVNCLLDTTKPCHTKVNLLTAWSFRKIKANIKVLTLYLSGIA